MTYNPKGHRTIDVAGVPWHYHVGYSSVRMWTASVQGRGGRLILAPCHVVTGGHKAGLGSRFAALGRLSSAVLSTHVKAFIERLPILSRAAENGAPSGSKIPATSTIQDPAGIPTSGRVSPDFRGRQRRFRTRPSKR